MIDGVLRIAFLLFASFLLYAWMSTPRLWPVFLVALLAVGIVSALLISRRRLEAALTSGFVACLVFFLVGSAYLLLNEIFWQSDVNGDYGLLFIWLVLWTPMVGGLGAIFGWLAADLRELAGNFGQGSKPKKLLDV